MSTSFPGESVEYRRARDQLLEHEIELRRVTEAVAQARRALPPGGVVREWRSDEVIIHVTMDRNGHVSTNMVIPVHRVPDPIQRFGRQSPLARLQRWLGL